MTKLNIKNKIKIIIALIILFLIGSYSYVAQEAYIIREKKLAEESRKKADNEIRENQQRNDNISIWKNARIVYGKYYEVTEEKNFLTCYYGYSELSPEYDRLFMEWTNLYRSIKTETSSIENKYNQLKNSQLTVSVIKKPSPGGTGYQEIPGDTQGNILEFFKSSIPYTYQETETIEYDSYVHSFIAEHYGHPVTNLMSTISALNTNGNLSDVNFFYDLKSKIEETNSFQIELPEFAKFQEIIDSQENRIYDLSKMYLPDDMDRFLTIPSGFIPADSKVNLTDASIEYLYIEEIENIPVLVPLVRVDGNVKTIDGEKSITFWVLAGEVK